MKHSLIYSLVALGSLFFLSSCQDDSKRRTNRTLISSSYSQCNDEIYLYDYTVSIGTKSAKFIGITDVQCMYINRFKNSGRSLTKEQNEVLMPQSKDFQAKHETYPSRAMEFPLSKKNAYNCHAFTFGRFLNLGLIWLYGQPIQNYKDIPVEKVIEAFFTQKKSVEVGEILPDVDKFLEGVEVGDIISFEGGGEYFHSGIVVERDGRIFIDSKPGQGPQLEMKYKALHEMYVFIGEISFKPVEKVSVYKFNP